MIGQLSQDVIDRLSELSLDVIGYEDSKCHLCISICAQFNGFIVSQFVGCLFIEKSLCSGIIS